jgi:hypothetical protein
MTDLAGSTGHGSSAYRDTIGQPLSDQPTADVPLDRYDVPADVAQQTQPFVPPSPRREDDGPEPVGLVEILHVDDDTGGRDGADQGWAPEYSTAPVAVRRADLLAGPLLLLAGMAAGVSLLVVWVHDGASGMGLVTAGLLDARGGPATLADTGSWQPLAVVGGGIVLFVLGLFMYVPAHSHRFLGLIALLASLLAAAGVLVPLAAADWDLTRWAVGAWCAVAVGGLGLLGALKAMSTGPRTPRS